MRKILTVFCAFILTGCAVFYEPYPSFERKIISQSDVPAVVWAAYREEFPSGSPIQIEQSTFGSRFLKYPKSYRFWVTDVVLRIYDQSGTVIEDSVAFPPKMLDGDLRNENSTPNKGRQATASPSPAT
ncbi:MAG TPA: hypothetical protein PLA50_14820 [Bacteroidia bacterium]|nr:hypothetical protein [Bacteroidia bacterium]